MDALQHRGDLRRGGLDPLGDLVAPVMHVAVLARRALLVMLVQSLAMLEKPMSLPPI